MSSTVTEQRLADAVAAITGTPRSDTETIPQDTESRVFSARFQLALAVGRAGHEGMTVGEFFGEALAVLRSWASNVKGHQMVDRQRLRATAVTVPLGQRPEHVDAVLALVLDSEPADIGDPEVAQYALVAVGAALVRHLAESSGRSLQAALAVLAPAVND